MVSKPLNRDKAPSPQNGRADEDRDRENEPSPKRRKVTDSNNSDGTNRVSGSRRKTVSKHMCKTRILSELRHEMAACGVLSGPPTVLLARRSDSTYCIDSILDMS